MNAFFDGYINVATSLCEFIKKYNNALQDKAEKEYEEDFRSLSTIIPCRSNSIIKRQFQVYNTHAKYMEVQAEFRRKCNSYCECVAITILWEIPLKFNNQFLESNNFI
jgi:hypothetical protein